VLMVVLVVGFPVALALAWFFELTPSGVAVDHGAAGAPRPAVTGMRRYADIAIIGVLVIAVAVLLSRQGGLIEESPREQVLAVLPFNNLSTDQEYAYFGDGLADTMIQKLGQLNELVVLASQSTFQFRGDNLDLEDVGAKLGATVIMLGSVQRAGDALRVNARLVAVDSGKQLWSGSYNRGVQDVFAIQDEIAGSVTEALHVVLAPAAEERLATPATIDLTAYEAYMLGTMRLASRTPQDYEPAIRYFQTAIRADPGYALAYAGLAEAQYLLAWRTNDRNSVREIRDQVLAAANHAMELDPGLGEAWLARALVALIDRDILGNAELPRPDIAALFEKAITLSPNNAMAHKYFANFFTDADGREDYELALLMKAARLDPRAGIIKINIGEIFLDDGDFDQAEYWFRQAAISQEPYFRLGMVMLNSFYLINTGRPDETARGSRAQWIKYPDDYSGFWMYLAALIELGAWDEAGAALEEMSARDTDAPPPGVIGGMRITWRWFRLYMEERLARAEGRWETAESAARELLEEYRGHSNAWPAMQADGRFSQTVNTLALADFRRGKPSQALARFALAYPGNFDDMDPSWNDLLRPPVMQAALYKRDGQRERAEGLLRDYLAWLRSTEEGTFSSLQMDWTVFTIHAMLGETDLALRELEARVNSGYLYKWWALKDGAFDPDYAAVLADPRFEQLYARITARVDELREGYLANPEPPEGYLR